MFRNRRNQKGCFASLFVFLIVGCCLALCAGVLFTTVFGALRSSDAYKQAIEIAITDPAVIEALGEPIEAGWFVTGSINLQNDAGTADLTIPLNGSRNDGTLYVGANKSGGVWTFVQLEVQVDGRERNIDLLGE